MIDGGNQSNITVTIGQVIVLEQLLCHCVIIKLKSNRKEKEFDNLRIRYGAREIVLDNDEKITILNKKI